MKKALALALFCLLAAPGFSRADDQAPQAAAPAIEPEKEALIRQVLMLSGAAKLADQMLDALIASFKKSKLSVPDSYWDDFRKNADTNGLIEQMIPLYARHFSDDDLRGLVAFYNSPAGKKYVAEAPQLTQESMAVGRAWGENLAKTVIEKLKADKAKSAAGQ
jgi:hypothetical protein